MQPDYDDLDDLDENGFNWMLVTVLLLAVAGFFALAWYAYETGTKQQAPGEVVVIKADNTPVRRAPEEPGGRTFPHQEKTIYEAISPESGEKVSIELAPQTEEPQLSDEPAVSADQKVAEILKQAVADAQKSSPAPKPTPAPEPVAEPVKVEEAPKAQAPTLPAAVVSSGERVQLGAFRSNAEAEKNWKKIARVHSSIIGNKPHQVVRADLGEKGVFYRLRVAGFADKDDATAFCKSLTAKGQGCFVVR